MPVLLDPRAGKIVAKKRISENLIYQSFEVIGPLEVDDFDSLTRRFSMESED